jgi:hypothetical protein
MRRRALSHPLKAADSTSARVRRKQIQDNASKTKEICLDFLGFLWWNLDFSMGYEGKNKKKLSPASTRVSGCGQNASTPIFLSSPSGLALPQDRGG